MYSVTVVNPSGEYVLHNTYDQDYKIVDPVLSLELNKSGTLTFAINEDHPNRSEILPMASEIYVYDDDEVFWIGRPLSIEMDFYNQRVVTCEGVLGYLLDTQVPPFDFTETKSKTIKAFLQALINNHNANCGSGWMADRKKFTLGNVTVTDSNNNIARSSEGYENTLETINQKLIDTHGGFFRFRMTGGVRYVDYIEELGTASQPITFGNNLLELESVIDTESLYTVIIPLGASDESTGKRLTLSGYTPTAAVKTRISGYAHGGALLKQTAQNGFPEVVGITDAAGVNNHGRVYCVVEWDDVTKQENLALKAAEYIGTVSVLGATIDLSAVDLSRISVEYRRFNLGEKVTLISLPHDINAQYQIIEMQIDLFNPANSTMTLGGTLKTYTFDNTKKVASVTNLANETKAVVTEQIIELTESVSNEIQNATKLLSGGQGGNLIIRQDGNGKPYEVLILNSSTEKAATRCVRLNQNGIGFGNKASGASTWTYRNAWTIDGQLIADFITTGTLKADMVKAAKLVEGTVGAWEITADYLRSVRKGGNYTYTFALYPANTVKLFDNLMAYARDKLYVMRIDTNGYIYGTRLCAMGAVGGGAYDVTLSVIGGGIISKDLHVYGKIYSSDGQIHSVSDRRKKDQIRQLDENALDFIMKLKPVEFVYKDNPGEKRYGFIAQDIQEIIDTKKSGLVAAVARQLAPTKDGHNVDKEEVLTINYLDLIADLVKTVQIQQDHISRLETRVEKLEHSIELLMKGATKEWQMCNPMSRRSGRPSMANRSESLSQHP